MKCNRVLVGVLAGLTVSVASADEVFQSVNADRQPGPFFWALDSIGWYWTPASDVELTGIQTKLTRGFNNINNNFTFTTAIYTDRPAAGGTLIDSFTWNGATLLDADWVGGSFDSPLGLSGGTEYFVGMFGWSQALGSLGANSGAGINWVSDPVGDPAETLGAGSSWSSQSAGDSFDLQLSPQGLGATDQPVIRFLNVPAPSGVAAMLGLAGVATRRRR